MPRENAAEMNPDGLGLHPLSGIFKSNYVDSRHRQSDYILARHGYLPWAHVVNGYTACALSFPSDKLIAFSAIAKQVASVSDDQYVAGMWHRFLGGQLLWSADSNRSKPTCYDMYIAPSWSWMSVNGRINTGSINWSLLIRVEDYELQYVTDDRMGAISGGWLRLIGSLKRMKLLRQSNYELECLSWSLHFPHPRTEHHANHSYRMTPLMEMLLFGLFQQPYSESRDIARLQKVESQALVISTDEPEGSNRLVTVMNGEVQLVARGHLRLQSETDVTVGFAEKWSQQLFP